MGKRKDQNGYMNELLGVKSAPQTHHDRPTIDPQTTHRRTTKKKYHIRLDENEYRQFLEYCRDIGISFSAGVRMAIKEFIKRRH
jgi:hypothetical protein